MAATLGAMAWTEVQRPLLALPIGSCEQHGPHLPLDTDTRIAVAVAEGLAEHVVGLRVAPAITVSASGEHAPFPGTLSIGSIALELVLVELVRSADWSRGVVFVNGHGGNLTAIRNAERLAAAEGRNVLGWWPRLPGGDAHAGRTETSLMLHLHPTMVRNAAAVPGRTEPIGELMQQLLAGGVAAVSPNGVLGDPTGASAEEGRDLLAAMIADATDRVSAWVRSLASGG